MIQPYDPFTLPIEFFVKIEDFGFNDIELPIQVGLQQFCAARRGYAENAGPSQSTTLSARGSAG